MCVGAVRQYRTSLLGRGVFVEQYVVYARVGKHKPCAYAHRVVLYYPVGCADAPSS